MLNEKEAGACMQAMPAEQAEVNHAVRAPVSVAHHVLREALGQAERQAAELDRRIKEECGERDNLARRLGAAQEHIDTLKRVHGQATRHVRELQSALS